MQARTQWLTHRHTLSERRYGMKKHDANRLHYDLRLEWNGVLLSWAVPHGPDRNPRDEREAIEMEDHRSKYITFEGVHRTGTIMLWDIGTWQPHYGFEDVTSCLKQGVLRFILRAQKLQGGWILRRTNKPKHGRQVWTLRKEADEFAVRGMDMLLQQHPNSVREEKTMEDIVRQWNGSRNDPRQYLLPFHT